MIAPVAPASMGPSDPNPSASSDAAPGAAGDSPFAALLSALGGAQDATPKAASDAESAPSSSGAKPAPIKTPGQPDILDAAPMTAPILPMAAAILPAASIPSLLLSSAPAADVPEAASILPADAPAAATPAAPSNSIADAFAAAIPAGAATADTPSADDLGFPGPTDVPSAAAPPTADSADTAPPQIVTAPTSTRAPAGAASPTQSDDDGSDAPSVPPASDASQVAQNPPVATMPISADATGVLATAASSAPIEAAPNLAALPLVRGATAAPPKTGMATAPDETPESEPASSPDAATKTGASAPAPSPQLHRTAPQTANQSVAPQPAPMSNASAAPAPSPPAAHAAADHTATPPQTMAASSVPPSAQAPANLGTLIAQTSDAPLSQTETPVKIALSAGTSPDLEPLAVRIARHSEAGENQFTIRLDPPSLGRIDVRLHVDAEGQAQAQLSADRPQTLHLLQREAATLERVLKEAGLDLGNGLSFSLKGEGRHAQERADNGRSRTLRIEAADGINAAAPSIAARWNAQAYGGTSRLDIRV